MEAIMLSVLVLLDSQTLEIQKPYREMEDCLAKAMELVGSDRTQAVSCDYLKIEGKIYRVTFGQET